MLLFSFQEWSARFLLLVSSLLFIPTVYLWNGYVDGYQALFGVLAVLLFAEWHHVGRHGTLLAALCCTAVAASLKNEGLLFAATIVFSTVLLLCARGRDLIVGLPGKTLFVSGVMVLFAGCLTWLVIRACWGLENDLDLGRESLPRIVERAGQAEFWSLASKWLVVRSGFGAALIVLAIVWFPLRLLRARLRAISFLPLLAACLYTTLLFFVYAATTRELEWHLRTSSGRIMLGPVLCVFASAYLVLARRDDDRVFEIRRGRAIQPGTARPAKVRRDFNAGP
jgi:hypothetical protein